MIKDFYLKCFYFGCLFDCLTNKGSATRNRPERKNQGVQRSTHTHTHASFWRVAFKFQTLTVNDFRTQFFILENSNDFRRICVLSTGWFFCSLSLTPKLSLWPLVY